MGGILHDLILMPLKLIFDVLSYHCYMIFYDERIVIILLSICVSLLTMPLYRRAERLRLEEKARQEAMKPRVEQIRRAFKGDERMMMLAEYYRLAGYRQSDSLWTIVPLLLQIPFFMAAYQYLRDSWLLTGISFLGLRDLAMPDHSYRLGTVYINILPIAMTVVNLLSSFIYLRGASVKEKLQTYLLALFFLIFLYERPSGIVLYWLCNNLFSLLRNVIDRYSRNRRQLRLFLLCLPAVFYYMYVGLLLEEEHIFTANGGLLLILSCLPLLYLPRMLDRRKPRERAEARTSEWWEWGLPAASLALLYGAAIPLTVIMAAPGDFTNIYHFYHPMHYAAAALRVYIGVFLVWGGVIYALIERRYRWYWSLAGHILLSCSLVNFLIYGRRDGLLSSELVLEKGLVITDVERLSSIVLTVLVALLAVILWRRLGGAARRWVSGAVLAGIASYLLLGSLWTAEQLRRAVEMALTVKKEQEEAVIQPEIFLSRSQRNVLIIMMDRAISGYLPYLFAEKPQLEEQFDGFIYYPDTVSYARNTVQSTPSLFGGYDYTPAEIDRREGESLADKHNEAISVLPVLFSENGCSVLVADVPYAGYQMVPDYSIYDSYPGVSGVIWNGRFQDSSQDEVADQELTHRRFLYYSIFRCVPRAMAEAVYTGGSYMFPGGEMGNNRRRFLNAYNVLVRLPELTEVSDDGPGFFLMMANTATHEPCDLQLPDYAPEPEVDNSAYSTERLPLHMDTMDQIQHYQVNMASMLQLGRYMDYLREQGVYENTRIIIVADHGRELGQFDELLYLDGTLDVEALNPLLLYKDFGGSGFTSSEEMRTLADVPYLALEGLIEEPINPFTGHPITLQGRPSELYVTDTKHVELLEGDRFDTSDAPWYWLRGSIFDEANWERLEGQR